MFKVVIDINENFLKIPREGDKWIMQLFVRAGFNKEDLLRLNRVRVRQQVLFLSCVLGALSGIQAENGHTDQTSLR